MARFFLIRHGQQDYMETEKNGFWGFGRDFAPLTKEGITQAVLAAQDSRIQTAELIVSSPYTRALQTAQIISEHTGLKTCVEVAMHEWIPDLTNRLVSGQAAVKATIEFSAFHGVYPAGKTMQWETLEHMRNRMRSVADRYCDYDTVIMVGHGMAFRTIAPIGPLAPGAIAECEYYKGQADCKFEFD